MKKKIVTLCLVAALAVTAIGGTLAYFTDTSETATNTFTVGNVKIELDEADVDEYGKEINNAERVTKNEYKLIPGHKYVKDPTVTVSGGSEKTYVRMFVTFNKADVLKDLLGTVVNEKNTFLPQNFVYGWDANVWKTTNNIKEENNTLKYEFRYYEIVDALDEEQKLDALFDGFTLPSTLTNEQVAELNGLTITVYAEAIQADSFDNAEEAFAALDAQVTNE